MRTGILKSLWNRLRRSVEDWMGDDESSDAADPSLMFHLVVSTPLLICLLAIMRKV